MYITINKSKCMGHARCYSEVPSLLSDDEEGFVAERGTTFEVPAHLHSDAAAAVNSCPELAISLSEGRPGEGQPG